MSGQTLRPLAAVLLAILLGRTPAAAQSFTEVDAAVRSGIARGVYPGAVLVIGRRDTILLARGYGRLTWSPSARQADPDSTLWDLASVSKVVGTAAAALVLVDHGRLALDAPLPRYLPRFAGGRKGEVTVRMLLDHTSGLPAYREYFRLAKSREEAESLLYAEPLTRAPGMSAVYSDLNAMLLGLVIEKVSGESLDAFLEREVFAPLGMTQTRYNPAASLRYRVAPTGMWHGRPSAGEVFDRNAAVMGGVSGHAGLFSTGMDLARYAQFWFSGGRLRSGGALVKPATIAAFLQPGPGTGTRLLGWDTPDRQEEQPTAYGTLLSGSAYGHTGWTGTELWLDPANDLFLIFLTNRSYAPRMGRSMRELRAVRAQLADAAIRAAGQPCLAQAAAPC